MLLVIFTFAERIVKDYLPNHWGKILLSAKKSLNEAVNGLVLKIRYMDSQNYPNTIIKQSQEKFNLMKARMLAPIKQIQQFRKENLKNLLIEIEKKQNLLQEKKANLTKLCQE